jgi:hypothetical protein
MVSRTGSKIKSFYKTHHEKHAMDWFNFKKRRIIITRVLAKSRKMTRPALELSLNRGGLKLLMEFLDFDK